MGVAAIFGPQSPHTASHVQSICDTMEVPHLETRWDYRLRRESCLVNLYPHPSTLSKVNTPPLNEGEITSNIVVSKNLISLKIPNFLKEFYYFKKPFHSQFHKISQTKNLLLKKINEIECGTEKEDVVTVNCNNSEVVSPSPVNH